MGSIIEQMANYVEGGGIKNYFSLLEDLHILFFHIAENEVLADFYSKINKQLIPFRHMTLSYPNSLELSMTKNVTYLMV